MEECLTRSIMKNRFATALIVLLALALLPGCGRKTADEATPQPEAARTASAPHSSASVGTDQTAIDPKTDMIRITGGRFMMGDKAEVDATPHEVVVSPFYTNNKLVTQNKFQKFMAANHSGGKGDKNPAEQACW